MENTIMLTKTRKRYSLQYYEMNTSQRLKESVLLLFLQDIASDNADINGFGYNWCNEHNLGWFLLKYRIELSQYPQNYDYIDIETESRGANKLFAYRDFEIFAPNNISIGHVASCWGLVDMSTKSLVAPQSINPQFEYFEKKATDLKFNKIILPKEFNYQKNYEVRYDDLDLNHHANNSNYISWALETLPYDFRKNHTLSNVDILLKNETTAGELITARTQLKGSQTIHIIKNMNNNTDLAHLNIEWKETD